jgi:hypothetical protein
MSLCGWGEADSWKKSVVENLVTLSLLTACWSEDMSPQHLFIRNEWEGSYHLLTGSTIFIGTATRGSILKNWMHGCESIEGGGGYRIFRYVYLLS